MSEPVHELCIIFAASEEGASQLLELVTAFACRKLGGTGEGEQHVCRGFFCASVGPAADWD
jgi:hypothetical protein